MSFAHQPKCFITKKAFKLGTAYGIPIGGGIALTGGGDDEWTELSEDFTFTPGNESIQELTGGTDTSDVLNTNMIDTSTVETPNYEAELEDLSKTDTIDVGVGEIWTNKYGVNFKRISEANDSTAWEIVE